MAAQDSKASPSNKEVQQPSQATRPSVVATKETGNSGVDQRLNETSSISHDKEDGKINGPVPSYCSSESSKEYCAAKESLATGDFEKALELIEEGIEHVKTKLLAMGLEVDFHESMAPFHYLYGTTLLYSVEESNDTQMTVSQEDNQSLQLHENGEASAYAEIDKGADAVGEIPEESEAVASSPAGAQTSEYVEDMEIAWENLDIARTIVERLLNDQKEKRDGVSVDDHWTRKLQLDLSQILLREGDLQRMNGRYSDSIPDYEECLHFRTLLLPETDRKIADVQYNLGLSYLSSCAELQKEENPDVNKQHLARDHFQKGVKLYVDCARTLCAQIAQLCGVEKDTIFGGATPGRKTMGSDDSVDVISDARKALNTWKGQIRSLKPVSTFDGDQRVDDLRELLDEIQETVEEAERSHQAVREASQLKMQAQAAITQSEDGSTTQIGFDTATVPSVDAMSDEPKSALNQPAMLVRKKKRDIPKSDPKEVKFRKTE